MTSIPRCCDMDGTANKARLGANAILAVSMAAARASATQLGIALYRYLGGIQRQHSARAHDEYPQWRRACRQQRRLPGIYGHAGRRRKLFGSPAHGAETFHVLKGVLKKRGYNTSVGDEGGFAPSLKSNVEAIEVILEAITQAGYKPGEDSLSLSTRRPANCTTQETENTSSGSRTRAKTSEEMVKFWADWVSPVSDRLAGRRPGRRRLGRLEDADRGTGQQDPTRRRRSFRDEHPELSRRASRPGPPIRFSLN